MNVHSVATSHHIGGIRRSVTRNNFPRTVRLQPVCRAFPETRSRCAQLRAFRQRLGQPPHPVSRREQAVSLLEILTVVSIVAVLFAVLVPSVRSVTERGSATQCASNMRQVGAALLAYAAENDGCLPPVVSPTDWTVPYPNLQKMWPHKVWTYAGYDEASWQVPAFEERCQPGSVKKNVFRCPKMFGTPQTVPGTSQGINPNRYSYGLNTRPAGGPHYPSEKDNNAIPIRLVQVGKPSATLMLNENSFCSGSYESFRKWTGLIPHNKGSNLLFFDGHGEWRLLKNIPGPGTSEGSLLWDGQ